MQQRALTTRAATSSRKIRALVFAGTWLILGGCTAADEAQASPRASATRRIEAPKTNTPPAPESSLGVGDVGIFSDLDPEIQLALPRAAKRAEPRVVLVEKHHVLVLYLDGWPSKVYPMGGPTRVNVGASTIDLRPGDAAELRPLLTHAELARVHDRPAPGDLDDDGIPDPLDVLVGAKKTVANGAAYGAGYIQIEYPGGDVPRHQGVCTDVVIRALRNSGLDLQRELQDDLRRSRRSYSMVKKPNHHIDHRRVKTLLPLFERHWQARSRELDDRKDPYRPGDVIFMDTFPNKPGPDHIGIVSDRLGEGGLPLVINNWTDGFKTSEMDLLGSVPVTHRFRFPSR